MAQKAAGFVWGPGQQKALQQVQDAVQTTLPFGLYDPTYSMVLKVSVAGKNDV